MPLQNQTAVKTAVLPDDHDVHALIAAWPRLTADVRQRIKALIDPPTAGKGK
jgi:hypothetical protein